MASERTKPLVRRARADLDVLDALDYYLDISAAAAEGFIEALERAFDHVRRHPAIGSPRYGQELNIPGLRFWRCSRYPYLVFYVEFKDRLEVWRVLHDQRDMPRWLQSNAE